MGSNQDGESCMTSKDEQLKDIKSSSIVGTAISQHCKVADSNQSVDTCTVDEKTRKNFSKMSLNTEPGEESNTNHVSMDDPPGQVVKKDVLCYYTERILEENYHVLGYPTPILMNDLSNRRIYHNVIEKKEFPYPAVFGFGIDNFMSYAAYFCKYEVENDAEIISIGSGNGMVDREIISTYRKHFGEEIKITLVDPDPDFEVDFRTVDDLINARPEAVGNCILLIIWPEPTGWNDGYDIDAIRKLQPLAALVLYDPTGVSGSKELTGFLRNKTNEIIGSGGYKYDEQESGLKNYAVEKVTGLQTYCEATRYEGTPPAVRHLCLRLIKLKKLFP